MKSPKHTYSFRWQKPDCADCKIDAILTEYDDKTVQVQLTIDACGEGMPARLADYLELALTQLIFKTIPDHMGPNFTPRARNAVRNAIDAMPIAGEVTTPDPLESFKKEIANLPEKDAPGETLP